MQPQVGEVYNLNENESNPINRGRRRSWQTIGSTLLPVRVNFITKRPSVNSSDCPTCKWKTVLIFKEKYHSVNQMIIGFKNRRIHLNRDSFVIVVAGVSIWLQMTSSTWSFSRSNRSRHETQKYTLKRCRKWNYYSTCSTNWIFFSKSQKRCSLESQTCFKIICKFSFLKSKA